MKTGKRVQLLTEEDYKIILENLDKLYKTYGEISNCALSLQADILSIENEFKKCCKEVE